MNASPLEGAIADLQAAKTTPELIQATKNLCNLRTVGASTGQRRDAHPEELDHDQDATTQSLN